MTPLILEPFSDEDIELELRNLDHDIDMFRIQYGFEASPQMSNQLIDALYDEQYRLCLLLTIQRLQSLLRAQWDK